MAKAYTITLDTRTSLISALAIEPMFEPDAAETDATFAIQAIDPATGADLTDAAEAFNTKFGPANLFFNPEATTFDPSLSGQALALATIGSFGNLARGAIPANTKIPASNTGHLAYKITITPKPGSVYDGHKAHVFVKIAIRG